MKKTASIIVLLVLVMALPAWADMTLSIKLNFFGPLADGNGKSNVTTSFYLKSIVQRNLQVAFSTATLQAELQKTFNAPKVSLLASGDLVWKSGGEPSVMQIVQINGRDYALILTPLPRPGAVNFKVGVVEENNQKNIKNILLDTEIVLPDREVALLGFRDAQENSYFIAFYVQGRDDKINKDVLQLSASQKPKKIKHVDPVYPAAALEKKIQGMVRLEATTDTKGQVINIQAISSPDPLLIEAAIAAVKQWVYEPYIVKGEAKAVAFTVTVTFTLQDEPEVKNDNNALARLQGAHKPRIIKKVNPVYPEEALKKKIAGTVVIEATSDEKGLVIDTRIIKSPDPLLTDAAVAAVKQWVYEPYVINGKAKPVAFTVTVTFSLNDEPEAKNENNALVRLQGTERPQVIKHVDPLYPAEALEKKIAGPVVLEVAIDEKGNVTNARLVSSPDPLLTAAAIAAVKQWVYAPYIKNGKAMPAVFKSTVTFLLNKE
jgi:TonB family protein